MALLKVKINRLQYFRCNELYRHRDQFVGGGTTAVEAKLTGRNFIGIDINQQAVDISKNKCNFKYDTNSKIDISLGDARKLNLQDESTHSFKCKRLNHSVFTSVAHKDRAKFTFL